MWKTSPDFELTNSEKGDIITLLSHERQERSGRDLGKEKIPKKHLTSGAISDIILKLLKRAAHIEKKFLKKLEKVLDKKT